MSAPPGGEWFWEDKDVFVHSASYQDAVDQVRRHLREKGIDKDPAEAIAEFMCPRMPRGFCAGPLAEAPSQPAVQDYVNATVSVCMGRDLEDIATVQRRMAVCASCPKCSHPVCVTCHNIDKALYSFFNGRRAELPEDAKSGVCGCTQAFVLGTATVKYEKDEPAWEGTPDSCWRKQS